jgi:thiol-disulfide isomerase/thioredoxin
MRPVLAFALGAVIVVGLVLLERNDAPDSSAGVQANAPFPGRGSLAQDFSLPVLLSDTPFVGTDSVRLSDYSGQYVYLDVFGSWCIPCREKYPDMFGIADEIHEAGGVILGLLLENPPEAAAEYFAENGGQAYPFLILDDETSRDWGLTGAPMGFLISPEGRIERVCFGCKRGASRVETVPRSVRDGLAERQRASS